MNYLEIAIDKYCKKKKNGLTYKDVLECNERRKRGEYLTYKVMDVIFEFKTFLS